MLRVTRSIEFSTSLRYRREDWTEAENRARFGREADHHGHNYRLEITLRGEADSETGMVINLSDLKEIAEREIMDRFDHKDLNRDTQFFEKMPPTQENFAGVIFEILQEAVPDGLLDRIRLHQDSELFVDVIGGDR